MSVLQRYLQFRHDVPLIKIEPKDLIQGDFAYIIDSELKWFDVVVCTFDSNGEPRYRQVWDTKTYIYRVTKQGQIINPKSIMNYDLHLYGVCDNIPDFAIIIGSGVPTLSLSMDKISAEYIEPWCFYISDETPLYIEDVGRNRSQYFLKFWDWAGGGDNSLTCIKSDEINVVKLQLIGG